MADWRVDVLKGLGAPLSKQNMNFLATWQRWEGGHTNNDARWNWLNTTSNAPGAIRSINSVGVKAFDSYHDGINATIQTLNNGRYPDVVEALRKGDPYSHKPVAGLSTWLSGQPASKSGLAYASRVLGGPVQSTAPVTQGPKVPKASGQGNASVRAGGQTYGGGRVSPQRLLASSDADSMYQQALSGFLLGRASARLRGENPTGGLLELVQLRDQYQAMGGVPDAAAARTTASGAISKVAKADPAQVDGGTTKFTGRMGRETGGVSDVQQRVLSAAHKQVGQPYVWGAESRAEGGFDCSGLIDYAYRQAGINLPGRLTTYTAAKLGRSVKGQALKPGDMVISNGGKHMTMYVGDGKVIAAPHTGTVVQYQPLSRFAGDIVDIRRVLP